MEEIRQDRLPVTDELYGGSLVDTLEAAAYEMALQDEAYQDAAQRWRDCMQPLGIPDLPTTPEEGMPTPFLREEFGDDVSEPDVLEPWSPPSVEEIEIAVEDAKCRESSGVRREFYDAEVEAQLEAVAENEDALERVRAAVEEDRRRVEEILSEYGA
ncbi:MAG: hypothetical protein ACRD29_16925 [Acidimicrobiales bacterium]